MFGIVLQVIGGFVVTIVLLAMLLLVSLNVSSFVYDLNRVEGYTNYEQDLVYLHQFPRASGKQVPNISPYGIKLETWLRQHKLKYKVVETFQFSKNQQIPFIVLNGEQIADSQLIIKYLSKYFQLDDTEGLSPQLLATSRAFRSLIENSFAWTVFYFRYVDHCKMFAKVHQHPRSKVLNTLTWLMLKWNVKKNSHGAGIGRYAPHVIYGIGCDDIRAISHFLGDKKYLCGDKMTMVDCSAFGQLVQVLEVTSMPYPQREVIESECLNLRTYIDRIKGEMWPDWSVLTHDGEFQ